MIINETYSYKLFAANAAGLVTNAAANGALGGFFCTVAGNLQITENTSGGAVVIATFAVAVGIFYTMPFNFPPGTACYATLTGGAAGTFAYN